MNCNEFKNLIPKWKNEKYTDKKSIEFYEHLSSCVNCIKIINQIEVAQIADFNKNENCDISQSFIEVNKEIQKFKQIKYRKNNIMKLAASFIIMAALFILLNNKTNKISPSELSIKWKTNLFGQTDAPPIICHDKIVIKNSSKNILIAYDKVNGKEIWKTSFEVIGDFITDKDKIYSWGISNNKINLLSINSKTGDVIWEFDCSKIKKYSRNLKLTLINNAIYLTEKQQLFSLDSTTGTLNWSKVLSKENGLLSTPVVKSSSLFIATRNKILELNINDGVVKNEKKLIVKSGLFSRNVLNISKDRIYILSKPLKTQGKLTCYNLSTLKKEWERNANYATNFEIVKDNIFVRANTLQVFNKLTGSSVWSEIVGGCGVLAYQDDLIYLINDKNKQQMMTLDTNSGKVIDSLSLSDTSCNEIIIDETSAYLNTNNGSLYAINIR